MQLNLPQKTNLVERSFEALGTQFTIGIFSDDKDRCHEIIASAEAECERIERRYSRFIEGSIVSQLGKSIGVWSEVDDETLELLLFSQRMKVITDGFFDSSVCSVLERLGYDREYSFEKREGGSTGSVEIDIENSKVRIECPIDFGGFGKGYTIDRIAKILNDHEHFYINAGGDVYCHGKDISKEVEGDWEVYLAHPTNEGEVIGSINCSNLAVATSSPTYRSWGGVHHLIDPFKNESAHQMLSVYVKAPKTIEADAWATALFVMGYEKAKELLIAKKPVEAMLIGPTGLVFATDNFGASLFS